MRHRWLGRTNWAVAGVFGFVLPGFATSAGATPSGCLWGSTADLYEQSSLVFEGRILDRNRTNCPRSHELYGSGYWIYTVQMRKAWKGLPPLSEPAWLKQPDPRPGIVRVQGYDPDGGPYGDGESGKETGKTYLFFGQAPGGIFAHLNTGNFARTESGAWRPGKQLVVPNCNGIRDVSPEDRCVLAAILGPENAKVRPRQVDISQCAGLSR